MSNQIGKQSYRKCRETDKVLRSLIKAPETAHRIFEFAESLYFRDETAERLSLAEIRQVELFLKQTENDLQIMKKQFRDLAESSGSFESGAIPVGF